MCIYVIRNQICKLCIDSVMYFDPSTYTVNPADVCVLLQLHNAHYLIDIAVIYLTQKSVIVVM